MDLGSGPRPRPLPPGQARLVGRRSSRRVTLGNITEAAIFVLLGALAWRYMSTLFAVTIFPRMPDDPGVRFAVVTLCRYAVLGLSSLAALSAVHLDLAKIGVVLAALGVGLGFGLQEIVSNFVCGIILLLERPIRIGDVVTVAGTTGKVDRINIRATTIVNGDNQSMIVPNREFITGNLVNWTLKDKILRVAIKLSVAYGTDPDRVVTLLLSIARQDANVLLNPAPSAALEGFGDSALLFGLYAFVPDPGLGRRRPPPALLRSAATFCIRRNRDALPDPRASRQPRSGRPHPRPGLPPRPRPPRNSAPSLRSPRPRPPARPLSRRPRPRPSSSRPYRILIYLPRLAHSTCPLLHFHHAQSNPETARDGNEADAPVATYPEISASPGLNTN